MVQNIDSKNKKNYDAADLLNGNSQVVFPKYKDLAGTSVFITGGASGIGAYFVAAFALQGAKVGFVSLAEDSTNDLCDRVDSWCGFRPESYSCDIRDIASLKECMSEFQEKHGGIGVLINNAARDVRHDVSSYSVAQWDDVLNTNLRPHYFTTQFVVDGMRQQGRGSIINVGSNSANLGMAGFPTYVASKAAIVGLTKALARELGPDNIRVNALIPGWVMTERQKELWVTPEALAQCLDRQSIKATVSGEDIAQAALFLAANTSAMITGQSLIVDGGRA